MKRYLLAILMLLLVLTGAEARTFVLVTGVSNYNNPASNLSQSTKDAKRFREVMSSQTKDITILTSRNVTRQNVLEKLQAICNRAQKGDRIIFFYSGHGMPGGIYGYDGAISYDDIISKLSSSSASVKICFIDACHSGSAAGNKDTGWMRDVKSADDQIFFVSSRPDEYSLESPDYGAGFFSQALLKGMRGKADKNGDRKITVLELFKYIYADVLKRCDEIQHPQLICPQSLYDVVVTRW